MKTISILFLLTLWMVPEVWGQKVEYQYDAAGNRKLRKVVTLQSSPAGAGMTKSSVAETKPQNDATEARVEEKYEDLLGERKVTIYPNPTQGMIRVEFQGYSDMTGVRLYLYDMQGKVLKQINQAQQSNTLDLSSYPAGMYILQMIEGKEKSEWKIVKE